MYFYSPSENTFIPESLIQDYIDAGTFFNDAIEVSDKVFIKYAGSHPPEGKIRIAGKNGLPTWGDKPLLSQEELIQQAEDKKQYLLAGIKEKTQLWQTQLVLGIINDVDKQRLIKWMLYAQRVEATDTKKFPVIWPEEPEDVA